MVSPEALDTLIAASLQSRRDKLVRAIRNQRIRTRFGFACSASIALLSLAAIFFAHDNEAATILAIMACLTFGFAYFVGKASQKKLADSLRRFDKPK